MQLWLARGFNAALEIIREHRRTTGQSVAKNATYHTYVTKGFSAALDQLLRHSNLDRLVDTPEVMRSPPGVFHIKCEQQKQAKTTATTRLLWKHAPRKQSFYDDSVWPRGDASAMVCFTPWTSEHVRPPPEAPNFAQQISYGGRASLASQWAKLPEPAVLTSNCSLGAPFFCDDAFLFEAVCCAMASSSSLWAFSYAATRSWPTRGQVRN